MKKLLFILTFILSLTALKAENKPDSLEDRYIDLCINGEFKYNYQKSSGFELGINFTTEPYAPKKDLFEFGGFLSCEYKVLGKTNCIAPKFGLGITELYYKFYGFGYCAKINTVLYEPTQRNDLRLLPEIGLTFLGIVNLSYSYAIPLTKNTIPEISNHVIACGVNVGYKRTIINVMDVAYGVYDHKRSRKH